MDSAPDYCFPVLDVTLPVAPAVVECVPGAPVPAGYDIVDDWIQCDLCPEWFLCPAIDMTKAELESIEKYYCKECREKYPLLKIIYKSSDSMSVPSIVAKPKRKRRPSFSERFASKKRKHKKRPDFPADFLCTQPQLDGVLQSEGSFPTPPVLRGTLEKPKLPRLKLSSPTMAPGPEFDRQEFYWNPLLPDNNSEVSNEPAERSTLQTKDKTFIPVPFTLEFLHQNEELRNYVANIITDCAVLSATVTEQDILDDLNDAQMQETVWRELELDRK